MDTLPVIVVVDGSPDSERALRWAIEEARTREAPLQIVHAWPYVTAQRTADGEEGIGDPVLEELRQKLRDKQFGASDLPAVEFRSLSGLTHYLLPALGAEGQLLVLGSRGRGGFASLLLGSNGMACAAQSVCPVVVVPRPDRHGTEVGADGEARPPAERRVTLGAEATSDEPGAIGFAFEAARRRGAKLRVVSGYMWPMPVPAGFEYVVVNPTTEKEYADELARELAAALALHRERYPEVDVDVILRPADAAGQLVEASKDSDLVVVARHRRRLPIGPRLGSVAHAVLLHAVCPIAVRPETHEESSGASGSPETPKPPESSNPSETGKGSSDPGA